MIFIIRNNLRRKGRTFLTVLGVAIGIFALAMIGAMGEYFSSSVDDAETYFQDRLLITAEKGSRLSKTTARRLQHIPGIEMAVPSLSGPMDDVPTVGVASTFDGIPPGVVLDPPGIKVLLGRHLQPGDKYHVLLGYSLAETKGATVGDTITILDHDFVVVGIWERSGRAYDRFAQIPLESAQEILNQPDYIDSITVVMDEGADAGSLAQEIVYNVPGIEVKMPEEMVADMRQAVMLFTATFASSSVLAALIGGLFIANTMIMAVSERVGEIGLKKAVGASNGDILREHLAEALAFGLAGWLLGIGLSWILINVLNGIFQVQMGLTLFVLSPRLMFVTFLFSNLLSTVGGLYPSSRAARLDPARALRSL